MKEKEVKDVLKLHYELLIMVLDGASAVLRAH